VALLRVLGKSIAEVRRMLVLESSVLGLLDGGRLGHGLRPLLDLLIT
jgi:hypothetical protein